MRDFSQMARELDAHREEFPRNDPEWPEPDFHRLAPEAPPPPTLDLATILPPRAASWVEATAECAGAPAGYVFASLLSAAGAAVGNARWVSPWHGWCEPPVLWTINIGTPSSGKSPGVDAALKSLREVERPLRERAIEARASWKVAADDAQRKLAVWDAQAKKAIKVGKPAPERPEDAEAGQEPHIPRLIVNDGTVERLAVIAERQPKGFLQTRDELAGFLRLMESRNGGSDRPFWLEAYGGRGFSVERMGRNPVTVDRLSICVCGSIQPGPLKDILLKSTDDGLLARFLPVWPGPVEIKIPERRADDAIAVRAFGKLVGLELVPGDDGSLRPWFCGFDNSAAQAMNDWRKQCRDWEADCESDLMQSFVGKLPGMAARLSLVLTSLAFAFDDQPEPGRKEISIEQFGRACHALEGYFLPMARRAYSSCEASTTERSARNMLNKIRSTGLDSFTARDVARKGWSGLTRTGDVVAAAKTLEGADILRSAKVSTSPSGGRPTIRYVVNPWVFQGGVR